MSCHNNNCGCSPSGYPSANNECCTEVADLARFAYANAQQAAASAANAATTLADVVQKSGDTMTGPLVLSGDPVVALGATTKQYVDNAISVGLTIPDGSITTQKLANLAVTTGKLADGSVTNVKLATNSVDANNIQDLTIITNKIQDNQITAAKLGSTERLRIAKAWVNFNGTTSPGTIRSSYNVSSVTRNATGDYTINFTNALTDADYSVVAVSSWQTGGAATTPGGVLAVGRSVTATPLTTTSVRLVAPSKDSSTFQNPEFNCVTIFGD